MIYLIFLVLIGGAFLSRRIFGRIINPIGIYCFSWLGMLSLYQLKLIRFVDINMEAQIMIFLASISIIGGAIFYYLLNKGQIKTIQKSHNKELNLSTPVEEKTLRIIIIFCSLLGIIGAVQHWMILLNKFGSIPAVLLNLNEVYRMRLDGEIKGVFPYVKVFPFTGVFFSAIYFFKKNKINLYIILPQIAVILSEVANVGRAGILYSFILFLVVVKNLQEHINMKKILNIKRGFGILVVITLLIFAASSIRALRGIAVDHNATTRELKSLRESFLINPSIYLYACGHVGTFSKYVEKDFNEDYRFADVTLRPFYNFLAKFNFVDYAPDYPKGYNIPIWINTGTYLLDLHQDYGTLGLFIIPFLMGYFAIKLWARFRMSGTATSLLLICYMEVLVFFTFLEFFTRFGPFFIGFFISLAFALYYDWKTKKN